MNLELIQESLWYSWVILPILIVIARIGDVTLGTLRVLFTAKGYRGLAPLFGFFEVMVWLLALSQIFRNLSNIACYIAYAGGFSLGTYLGMMIESKIAMGMVLIRIVTRVDADELVVALRSGEYGVTVADAEGMKGPVKILFTLVARQKIDEVIVIIKQYNPAAFYSVEDVRFVREGSFYGSRKSRGIAP